MDSLSLFIPISYAAPVSCKESFSSVLNNYFYLGGKRITIIEGNKAKLEDERVLCYVIALKIASYILLFPLTLTLFVLTLGLRYQQKNFVNFVKGERIVPDSSLGSLLKPEDKPVSSSLSLESLLQETPRDGEAFLIDFSKIKPSNIFSVFSQEHPCTSKGGDAAIEEGWTPYQDSEVNKFNFNFPFKYRLEIAESNLNAYGYRDSSVYAFTMNEQGEVESYGVSYKNFDLFLEHYLNYKENIGAFSKLNERPFLWPFFDFASVLHQDQSVLLRKKRTEAFLSKV